MTALDVEVGRSYIVTGNPSGLVVSRCEGKAADGDVLLRSRVGGIRGAWSRRIRRVSVTAIRRLATAREVAVGMAIHPVPPATAS